MIIKLREWGLINMIEDKLLENRIIIINGSIKEETTKDVVSKLLYLDSINNDDISIYINSPGGYVTDGFAIIDTMNIVRSDIRTYCIGSACSMAAVILSCGKKGKRYVLTNAEVMIHQPSGGAYGKSDDILISSNNLVKCKNKLIDILSKNTKKSKTDINKYFNNDYYMDSKEAVEFGIVDFIL